jgi:hypothetical protein
MGARAARGCAALLASILALTCALPALARDAPEDQPLGERLFVLQFNRWGELLTPGDVQLAVRELAAAPEIERIFIFSYGWAYDAEASHATYLGMLRDFTDPGAGGRRDVAVVAVGWDSSQSGFRRLFNNVIPLPGVADALAWLPDRLLFPISFWSKAAQADRIGFGELRAALNQIFGVYADRDDHPDVFLVGHSFGSRILSALMLERLGVIPIRAEPFVAAQHVKGAFLLQPAAVPVNLHRHAPYPVVATMSGHDHANGFLFPLANLPLNSFGFTAFEVMIRNRVIGPVSGTVRFTFDALGRILTAPLPDRDETNAGDEEPPGRESFEPVRRIPSRSRYVLRRTLAEVAAIPAALVFTLVATPVNYLYVQGVGLATQPIDHVMDTLAQPPLLEIAVAGLGRAVGREVPWGQRSKGFLTIGPLQESVGRMLTRAPAGKFIPAPVAPDEIFARNGESCGLVVCEGVLVVDATGLVREGVYGQDLGNPVWDFTLGWLDPIGAHGDYRNPEVVGLIRGVLERLAGRGAAEP